MARSLRITVYNTAELIYNHPSFCKFGDYQMSAVHCYNTHLYACKVTDIVWEYILNELDYLIMLNKPKIKKGILLPNPVISVKFDDMPYDIYEKIYKIKHKLELGETLSLMTTRHNNLLSYHRQRESLRMNLDFRTLNPIMYNNRMLYITGKINKKKYKPFCHVGNPNSDVRIEHSIYRKYLCPDSKKPDYIAKRYFFSYSRFKHFDSENFAKASDLYWMFIQNVRNPDLRELCSINKIPFNKRDNKKTLIKHLYSI